MDLKDFGADYVFNPSDLNGIDNYTDTADPDSNCFKFTSCVSTTCDYYNSQQFKSQYDTIPQFIFPTCPWNDLSIQKNYNDFMNYSIIAFPETWLTECTEMLDEIPMYKAVHRHRESTESWRRCVYISS